MHEPAYPTVCKVREPEICNCMEYEEDNLIPSDYQKQLAYYNTVKDKIKWILVNLKFSRNFTNKYFVFFYWQIAQDFNPGKKLDMEIIRKLVDPEVIRRAKQLLVAENSELYGGFNPTIEEAKTFKQYLIEEFVTSGGDYEKPEGAGLPPAFEV